MKREEERWRVREERGKEWSEGGRGDGKMGVE